MSNNIFHTTRVKLTLWYLLIIMILSAVFSFVVYTSLSTELYRIARREQQKIIAEKSKMVLPVPLPDPKHMPKELVNPVLTGTIKEEYINSKNNLLLRIVFINLMILGISAGVSYLLSGKTLKPIEDMHEKQKKFISDASHELRTPLTALKTAIEVSLKMAPLPHEKVTEILNSNLEDVNNLVALSNSLLSFEKYSSGHKGNNLSDIQVDNIVQKTVEKFKALADKSTVKIIVDSIPLKKLGDYESLSELISILVDNAIKYNKPNGSVIISLSEDANSSYIVVKDTGIGIAESNIPQIFERFYRVEDSRSKNVTTGHGLGLAIAYNIVKNHRGKINVKSELGKGTTFEVVFPKRR